jgi:hypothetical protein
MSNGICVMKHELRWKVVAVMEKDEKPGNEAGKPANENRISEGVPLDPRILRIAGAIGRQLAREHAKRPPAANDNAPRDDDEPADGH